MPELQSRKKHTNTSRTWVHNNELLQEWLRQRRQMVMKKRRSYHVPLTKEVADIKKTYN